MLKKAVSEAAADGSTGGVPSGYVEDLNDARTMLANFFSILLNAIVPARKGTDKQLMKLFL